MAFEKNESGGISITGEDDVRLFQMMSQIKALELEVRTGMKFSQGSVLKMVQRQHGIKATRKKDAVIEMKKLFNERSGKDFYDVD